ncbi:MAG: hypothetical protein SVT52_07415 [Planctomycetota bacterium]|nr:hypothetical protein [Planctomycetota bacterium]
MPDISPLAVVKPGAELAADVCVGPFSYIGPEVRIGAGCIIENNVTITGRTTLGDKNHVFPLTAIGASGGNGLGDGECVLGTANTIREHVTIYAGLERPTSIGTDNLVMIHTEIGDGAVIGDHGIFDNCSHIGSSADVGDYVRTSGFAAICPGVTVGAYTFVTGYASVDRDAPPYAIVQGFPIRVRGVNSRNLKRCGFGEDDISRLKQAFRELFNDAENYVDQAALKRLLAEPNVNQCVRRLLESLHPQAQPAGDSHG